ncbi:hypothetical protein RYX36_002502, partial [Vicia faba]
ESTDLLHSGAIHKHIIHLIVYMLIPSILKDSVFRSPVGVINTLIETHLMILFQKKSASYGGSDHGSNLSRNMGMGIGRTAGSITELGHKILYNKAGVGVSGTISGQRNGVGLKHSFSNTEATTISDAQHHPTRNITVIKRNVMSSSWKNSEEEEYMWDEMHTGLTSHGVHTNLGNDAWTADDENLNAKDNHHQIRNVFRGNVDREMTNKSQATQKK